MTDRKITHIASASLFVALLIALCVPFGESGRIIAAILLLPAAVLIPFFVKKRNILSLNKNQVLLIVTVVAVLYVMFHYLTGIEFGFFKNPYRLSFKNLFLYILPITAIVVCSEIVRSVLMAQKDRVTQVLCYLACVVADMLICSNIPSVTSFSRFMELVGGTLCPALISNLLFNYLSRRYGILPNTVYRLIMTLFLYLFPIKSQISDSLTAFINLMLPIAIYFFIDALYEKKRRYAMAKKHWFAVPITVLAVLAMLFTVMLVSNQFFIGAYVIATPSMTGELNRGDAAIYERYEDQLITEGQVIAFEKDGRVVVHRVVDIEIINQQARYYTKGDANEDPDAGYIGDENIIGLVNFKIPYIGYPTLWLRSLFSR